MRTFANCAIYVADPVPQTSSSTNTQNNSSNQNTATTTTQIVTNQPPSSITTATTESINRQNQKLQDEKPIKYDLFSPD